MQYLKPVNDAVEARYYEICGEYESRVKRYIVTTQESRDICNRPELMGVKFSSAMRTALAKALVHAPFRPVLEGAPQHHICVMNFLCGGLNFDLRNALTDAYGMNNHCSVFMSSQRYKTEGRWSVKEDMYRKLEIPRGAVLIMGDVVATGVTIENGFAVLLDQLMAMEASVKAVVFFTIGCHKLEKNLEFFDTRLREAFDDYQGAFAVYLESKLKLVDSKTLLRIGLPGTDLIRLEALLAPEFEQSQYDAVCYPLERCSIYDAGSRAFDVPSYVDDVEEYWEQVGRLADDGFTLEQALKERWPEPEYVSRDEFMKVKQAQWQGIEPELLESLYRAHENRWTDEFRQHAGRTEALAEVSAERIETLRNSLGGHA